MRRFLFIFILLSSLNLYGNINKEFIKALNEKKYVRITTLLEDGADIDKKDENGFSPLIAMTISGNHEMVQLLIKYGANISLIDNRGFTALHHAVELKMQNLAEILIENNAETNSISNKDETPVYLALKNNDIGMTELLIKNGGEIDLIPKIDPILEDYLRMRVSIRNRLYGLDYLVRTELMEAVFNGDYSLSLKLINDGADINEQNEMGLSPLMIAAGRGNSYLTRLLLKKGASISIEDEEGLTALSYSMLNNNKLVIIEILEKADSIDPYALFYALFEGKKEDLSILLKLSETVDVYEKSRRTLLMYAAYLGDLYAVRQVIDNYGRISLPDNNQMNALNYCILGMKEPDEDYYQIVSLLIEKGVYTEVITHPDPEMAKALKGYR